VRPCPADPREECQDWEQVTRDCVIEKAYCHGNEEESHPCHAFTLRLLFMQCSVETKWLAHDNINAKN